MRKMMSFMTGAILGGLAGATLALLLAPYSGDDLRSELQSRVEHIQREMKSAASQRRAEMEAQLQAMRTPTPTS